MASKATIATVVAVGVIVAAAVVLDSKRRSDPNYKKNLKQSK